MSLRSAIRLCVVLTLALPVATAGLLGIVRGLLAALGDEQAVGVVEAVGETLAVLWLLALTALVILLGLHTIQQAPPEKTPTENDSVVDPPA